MKEYYRELIHDFADRDLSAIKPRSLNLPDQPGRIITVIGARRVGKTYLLLYHINRLRNTVPASKLLYINFENDKLFPFTLEKAQQLIETYYEIYPSYKSEKVYFFFDEIQNIPEWHLFIRRLYDTENCFLFLTGSSSRLLSKEIATSLRGRTITFELFPLSFHEYVDWYGIDTVKGYSSRQKAELQHAFQNYLDSSALPELFSETDVNMQQAVLHEYINMVIYKDLIERHGLTQHSLIKLFIRFLIVNISNQVSINKIFNDFKSQGLQLSKNSLYEFLIYLEDSFIFYNTAIFTENLREQQRNPKKIYVVDIGLKLLMDYNADQGRLLENLVFLQLRRRHHDIFYLKDKKEVDFCYQHEGELHLINVAYSISDTYTYEREIHGLTEAMNHYSLTESTLIIGEGNGSVIMQNDRRINIIPAWQWMLEA
jgi:predicted AAA+ superfamily ATPase